MEKRLLLVVALRFLALLVLFLAAGGLVSADTPEPPVPTNGSLMDASSTPTPKGLLEEVIVTRVPEATPTPGLIEQKVEELVETVELARTTFLGISVADWSNLAISLLFVLAGYLIGTWLIRRILPRAVRRTPTQFDDRFLEAIGSQVRWLVVLITLYLAILRLTFVSAKLKTFLTDAT